jgi:type II secretory ATPase GspE/PulE/Tfp pilus assembly ATPase PilB-like protein
MVLSTLHTNSAEGAVTRLVDLGVPDFVVREVLRGVLAQDLVGVWCRECLGPEGPWPQCGRVSPEDGCAACAGRRREGAPVGRRLRVALKAFG